MDRVVLFASAVINDIERQTLNVLAPYLKAEYHWTNSDFAPIVIAFRASYAVVQLIAGRLVDVLGTRRGVGLAFAWYSMMGMTYTIGAVTDRYSSRPIRIVAGAAPVVATVVVFALVQNTRETGNGVLLRI